MRKFLLSLVLVALAGFASAQALVFEQTHNFQPVGPVEPGRFEIIADVNEMMELAFEMDVVNTTDETLSIICTREVIDSNSIAGNNFCFGNCFGDATSETTVDLTPGTPIAFSAHFKPYDPATWELLEPGAEMTVTYTFTERSLGEWKFEFYFKYDPTAGPYDPIFVEETYSDVNIFSNAYPNPANNVVNFDYNMPASANSAAIAIYNMMGQEVIRQDVNVCGSQLSINVSDLTDGIYFYSLIVNNQLVKTNKLVVSK